MNQAVAPHILTNRPTRPDPENGAPLLGDLRLARARVHEFCGASRHTLALTLAGQLTGPVFWITPAWAAANLNAPAIRRFLNPGRITFFNPGRAEDLLWTMEEALRAGAVPLVIADLPGPPGLTPVRRLHLAAETGAAEGQVTPLGVLLTPGDGGAQGVESRWSLTPRHRGDRALAWELQRRRARTAPERTWAVRPHAKTGLALADHEEITQN